MTKTDMHATHRPAAAGLPVDATAPGPGPALSRTPGRRVLVVDDDRAVREFFRRCLLLDGIDVVVAPGGAEGLQALGTDPAIGLILLDLDMPKIDGRRFREVQRSDTRLAAIPTVVVTGTIITSEIRDELQAVDYIAKPIDRTRLLAIVNQHLPTRDGAAA